MFFIVAFESEKHFQKYIFIEEVLACPPFSCKKLFKVGMRYLLYLAGKRATHNINIEEIDADVRLLR